MATQVARATCLAAALAVAASGLLALGLVQHSYDAQARAVLHREAVLVAGSTRAEASAPAFRSGRPATRVLKAAGVQIARVHADGRVSGPSVDPAADAAATAGQELSAVRQLSGTRVFVEVQPVEGDGGVVLTQRASDAGAVSRSVLRRLALALVVGLAAATLLGVVAARRLTRPLVRVAEGAHRLAAGEREVRLPEEGPVEVAALAGGLNDLAAALATSEGRQREFLLSISHELRTPLTAIRGYAEALADEVATGGEAVAAGRTIRSEAERLQRLVSDLLDLARLGADDFRLELADVDLGPLLADAAQVWSARCQAEGVPFSFQPDAAALVVHSDAGRLRQVVDGLAENALRVTPAGRPLVLALHREGPDAVVEVRDGGPGLTDDDLAVAFDRSVLYQRYRGVRRVGTGLGLALVGGLVGRLGGTATAGHAAEGGACFAVRLPLV